MGAPNTKLYLPALLAGVSALGVGLLAFLPSSSLAPSFALVDHDDSVHPLSEAQLAAVRLAFGATAALFAGLAVFMAGKRGRLALAQLGEDAAALLRDLRLPATASFGLILLAGLLVRVALLDGPMRFDESDTFDYFASRSLFNLFTDYTAPNNHILHTALVRLSYLLFGHSPPALRLPALAAGMLILPLTFLLARRLFDERVAYIAMALAAVHPGLVSYSANARGYTLLCVFTLTIFLAASFLRHERNRFAWLVFVAAGSLGMFTIPIMLYPLSAAAVWALWCAEAGRRKSLTLEIALAAAVMAGLSLAFYAPAAARTGVDAVVANRYVTAMSWQEAADEAQELLTDGWAQWTGHLSTPVWLALGAALLIGFRERESRRLAAAVLATALAWMALQRVVPYARVFLYAAPLIAIAAAAGLRRFGSRPWLAPALAGGLAVHLYLGYVWFPAPDEQTYAELQTVTPVLLEAAGKDVPVLAALPFSEPIRYAFLTGGRPRGQVLAPDVVSGALPPLAERQNLIVVRPNRPNPTPGFWIDLEDAGFTGFTNRKTLLQGENLEVIRLSSTQ